MPSIRDFIDPGGRMLARRLDQLCATLENLGARLRGTIANAIGETIGCIVRDTALRVLDEVSHYLPASGSFRSPLRDDEPDMWDRQQHEDERGYWDDGDVQWEPAPEENSISAAPERLPTALSAGLQAASWWLQRWSGHTRTISTMAVGLITAGIAFLGGPVVVAVLGLAQTATQFQSLSGAIETGAMRVRDFSSTG
jgi:hypothetical protein